MKLWNVASPLERARNKSMENLIADLRYAARTLVKTPAFLLVSVLTLALGIGGNIAIFTLVQAVLLQPLPFPQPERLVRIFDDRAGARDAGMSVPEFEDLRQHSDIHARIPGAGADRKSTRLNSSHQIISYAVFCLKKKIPRVQRPQAG